MKIDPNPYRLKLAETEAELVAAQRLRYRVFVQELGAKIDPRSTFSKLERDRFDPFFDHLILRDTRINDPMEAVVGVYRLLRSEVADQGIGYYGATEFDLSKIRQSGRSAVELGRSCVAPEHRGGVALHMLWHGLADYVLGHDIEIMFGTASFPGCDAGQVRQALSFLHHHYLAPEDLRVPVHSSRAIQLDVLPFDKIDKLAALKQMPPLIKAYLRLGGFIGEGAFLDVNFNTIDVCLIVDMQRISQKYRTHYVRGQAV